MNKWRSMRIKCDYYPDVEVAEEMCGSALPDASMILDTCKSLVGDF
jgi:uncharacterized protein (UPF0332 family)